MEHEIKKSIQYMRMRTSCDTDIRSIGENILECSLWKRKKLNHYYMPPRVMWNARARNFFFFITFTTRMLLFYSLAQPN